jgi:DNA (cytosine-5)-methyltransferase 1
VSTALNAKGGASRMDFESETFVAVDLQNTTVGGDVAGTLDTSRPGRVGGQAVFALQDVRPRDKAQNGRGWSDDGTAYTVDAAATQGVAIGPIPFDTTQITSAANRSRPGPGDPCRFQRGANRMSQVKNRALSFGVPLRSILSYDTR